jgi:hypothetical protein
MENNKNIHDLLANSMDWRNSEVEAPGLEHVVSARNAVMARKKTVGEKKNFLAGMLDFLNFDLKFYHIGLTVVLLMVGSFYISETSYTPGGACFSEQNLNTLSIKSSTISVNSSTMLTSIPTLRN